MTYLSISACTATTLPAGECDGAPSGDAAQPVSRLVSGDVPPDPSASVLDRLVRLLLGPLSIGSAIVPLIQALLDDGFHPEWLVSRLFVDAARRLGELWLADECTFLDVTIATQRLGSALVDLETRAPSPPMPAAAGQVLLCPMPGDQHGFGLSVLGYFLRRAGWDVAAPVMNTATAIEAEVAARGYDIVGLSIGHERAVPNVADLIRRIRARSVNPAILVAVGGPMVNQHPEQSARFGADLWAEDAAAFVKVLGRSALYTRHNPD